jgi:hypothetical protein
MEGWQVAMVWPLRTNHLLEGRWSGMDGEVWVLALFGIIHPIPGSHYKQD